MQKAKCTAIVLAAGQGKRMGTKIQKQYLEISGKPVLYYSLNTFQNSKIIDDIVLVVSEGQEEYCEKEIIGKYNFDKVSKIVVGVPNAITQFGMDCRSWMRKVMYLYTMVLVRLSQKKLLYVPMMKCAVVKRA